MPPTFFPPMVLRAIDRLETAVDGSDEEDVVSDARALLKELRHWEREWRDGKARLVVQSDPAWDTTSEVYSQGMAALRGKR